MQTTRPASHLPAGVIRIEGDASTPINAARATVIPHAYVCTCGGRRAANRMRIAGRKGFERVRLRFVPGGPFRPRPAMAQSGLLEKRPCLLYTSDAADERS